LTLKWASLLVDPDTFSRNQLNMSIPETMAWEDEFSFHKWDLLRPWMGIAFGVLLDDCLSSFPFGWGDANIFQFLISSFYIFISYK